LFTLGFAEPVGAVPSVIVFLAAATGLVIVTLQIAYLPTLYSAFNRRETEVALLNARAGVPSWGPELLARTHYALGSGVSTLDTMPDLYAQWERWAADIAESHTTYLPIPGPMFATVEAVTSAVPSWPDLRWSPLWLTAACAGRRSRRRAGPGAGRGRAGGARRWPGRPPAARRS